jgi:hypothetical protein
MCYFQGFYGYSGSIPDRAMFRKHNYEMEKRLLNIGLVSCMIIVFLQIFAIFYELMHLKILCLRYFAGCLNSIFNIVILVILWRVLVKIYKQSGLDYILKVMIIIAITTTLLLFLGFLHLGRFVSIASLSLLLINLIFYFIFTFRVMEIDKSEIHQIE